MCRMTCKLSAVQTVIIIINPMIITFFYIRQVQQNQQYFGKSENSIRKSIIQCILTLNHAVFFSF